MVVRSAYRFAFLLTLLTGAILAAPTDASASCIATRSFDSRFEYIYWPSGVPGSASFWAVGAGDPAVGPGIDSGSYPAYFWGYWYLLGSWSAACALTAGACSPQSPARRFRACASDAAASRAPHPAP